MPGIITFYECLLTKDHCKKLIYLTFVSFVINCDCFFTEIRLIGYMLKDFPVNYATSDFFCKNICDLQGP